MTIRPGGNAPRRVLFLAARLGPGGVTTHMATLAGALQDNGWDVAVASAGASDGHSHDVGWLERQGIRHYEMVFPQVMWSRDMLRVPRTAARGLQIAREYRPDIVHVHWRSASWCARLLKWQLGLPFVVTVHVDGIPSNRTRRVVSFWGDQVIAVSSDTRDDIARRFDIPVQRIQVIPYGIDHGYYRPPTAVEREQCRRKFAVPADDPVVCLIGSGWRRKGHDVLIRALEVLGERGTRVFVLLAGDEDDRQFIEQLSAEHRVSDRVRFLGYQDSRAVLWASDVLALPSRVEGLPIAVIEAMLCGVVPVRTPSAGASDQVIEGKTGFLVPFDDPHALADRLELLCRDSATRARIQEATLAHARARFTSTRMVSESLAVYKRALGASRAKWTSAD